MQDKGSEGNQKKGHENRQNSSQGDKAPATGPSSGSARQELLGHLREIEANERDLLKGLLENWQRVLGGIAIVLLGVFTVSKYFEKEQKKKGEASEMFSDAQQLFTELFFEPGEAPKSGENAETSADAAKTAEQRANKLRGLEDTLNSLHDRYPGTPYVKFSSLYRAALNIRLGNQEAGRNALSEFNLDRYAPGPASTINTAAINKAAPEMFFEEVAALLFARSLLSEEARAAEGRQRLIKLAQVGRFANVEALLAVIRIAGSAAERDESLKLAREVVSELEKSSKESASSAVQQLKRLGVAL